MKELLLRTVVIVGLFSSSHANDKEVVGGCGNGRFWGHLCILPINTTKAAANYHNDELKKDDHCLGAY